MEFVKAIAMFITVCTLPLEKHPKKISTTSIFGRLTVFFDNWVQGERPTGSEAQRMPKALSWFNPRKLCSPRALKYLGKEQGNVESAMVLIPLLILFLVGIQIIIAANLRNGDLALVQGDASRRAISGQPRLSDEVIELDTSNPFAHIRILITQRRSRVPMIVPGLIELMGGAPYTQVKGAAVMEEMN